MLSLKILGHAEIIISSLFDMYLKIKLTNTEVMIQQTN